MNKRKDIINAYKERKLQGGIYTITNSSNGKYLIGNTPNMQSMQNRFQASAMLGSPIHFKLKEDWTALGAQAFRLDVLEEREQKPEQTYEEFIADLKASEQAWRETLDASKEY